MPTFRVKRIYDPTTPDDGYRILVDRLWLRGVKKQDAHIDEWAKDLSPSTALRRTYQHVPEKWVQFSNAYLEELQNNDVLPSFLKKWRKINVITLLYAPKDTEHAHVLVLQEYLKKAYERQIV